MAERKATNRYYPPDWDPSKGNLNKYHGEGWRSVAATVNGRASANKEFPIIRMEMPFNVWCEGCKNHIGRGVRYNAEKQQVGMYFTTKIWRFRMKCHLCSNYMELQTDPKGQDYVCVSGVRRKVEEFSAKDAETVELMDDETKDKIASDPFYKLEHNNEDTSKAATMADALQQSYAVQSLLYKDDFSNSLAARKILRAEKHQVRKDQKNLKRKCINLDLPLPETEEDRRAAKVMATAARFITATTPEDAQKRISRQSIFGPSQRKSTHIVANKQHSKPHRGRARETTPAPKKSLPAV